jgi:hypothetical protein
MPTGQVTMNQNVNSRIINTRSSALIMFSEKKSKQRMLFSKLKASSKRLE